jgi:hypothetical protein
MKRTKCDVRVSWRIRMDLTFYHMHVVLYLYYCLLYRFYGAESGFGKRKKKDGNPSRHNCKEYD